MILAVVLLLVFLAFGFGYRLGMRQQRSASLARTRLQMDALRVRQDARALAFGYRFNDRNELVLMEMRETRLSES